MVNVSHTTIAKLRKMSPDALQKLINKMNKNPRGDLIMLLLALLNQPEQDITQHPFLKQAHARAKRAEAKLLENSSEIAAARRGEQAAMQRANNLAEAVQSLQHKVSALETTESELRDKLESSNDWLNELRNRHDAHSAELTDEIEHLRAQQAALISAYRALDKHARSLILLAGLGIDIQLSE